MITDHIEVIFEDLAALTMWTNYTVYFSYLIIFMCVEQSDILATTSE